MNDKVGVDSGVVVAVGFDACFKVQTQWHILYENTGLLDPKVRSPGQVKVSGSALPQHRF